MGAAQNRILPTCRRWVCGKYHGSLLFHRRRPWMDAGCRRAGAAARSKAPPDGTRVPLAPVVIGGLITSTLLTLILLPILFERFGESAGETDNG